MNNIDDKERGNDQRDVANALKRFGQFVKFFFLIDQTLQSICSETLNTE